MTNNINLTHEFVEYIPNDMKDGTIYVSMVFATAAHKCCCGCGHEVITPFSPTDWKLIYDGQSITLNPSIGNWSFACQSHYLIIQNRVRWAQQMSLEEINAGRVNDSLRKDRYFNKAQSKIICNTETAVNNQTKGIWKRLKSWLL